MDATAVVDTFSLAVLPCVALVIAMRNELAKRLRPFGARWQSQNLFLGIFAEELQAKDGLAIVGPSLEILSLRQGE